MRPILLSRFADVTITLNTEKTDDMTIITVEGGRINMCYLMQKTKDWLAFEYLDLFRTYGQQQAMAERALRDAVTMMREAAWRWEHAEASWPELDEIGKKTCAANARDCIEWRNKIDDERKKFTD
ncbi:hypothetical protein UFOVP191_50 [uncultured Caudovirales phage]|uniref:Uncharacterized protein n=1 Tax=uncultured Caudovirales phage TaxID=2100421 RepID=A0A6J7WN69_9CAUD|nr:hypothetical protein UFOVP191_50 [uncultured Caudovirales phage]